MVQAMTHTTPSPAQPLISISEAARRYSISPKSIRRRIAEGTIRGYRTGPKLIRVDPAEIEAKMISAVPIGGYPVR